MHLRNNHCKGPTGNRQPTARPEVLQCCQRSGPRQSLRARCPSRHQHLRMKRLRRQPCACHIKLHVFPGCSHTVAAKSSHERARRASDRSTPVLGAPIAVHTSVLKISSKDSGEAYIMSIESGIAIRATAICAPSTARASCRNSYKFVFVFRQQPSGLPGHTKMNPPAADVVPGLHCYVTGRRTCRTSTYRKEGLC